MRVFTTVMGQNTTAATEREVAPNIKVRSVDSTGLSPTSRTPRRKESVRSKHVKYNAGCRTGAVLPHKAVCGPSTA